MPSCRIAPEWIFLHGFAGGASSWEPVLNSRDASQACLWLPGHHPSAPVTVDHFVGMVDHLAAHLPGPQPLHVCGYSLGARLALGLVVRHPHRVARATLIGVNPGLEDAASRVTRAKSDAQWQHLLRTDGMAAFHAAWSAQPLFASQKRACLGDLRAQEALRHQQDPEALAQMLHATSLANMPNFWPALAHISLPVHYLTGALDEKFTHLARRAHQLTPGSRHTVLLDCGHNPLVEAPRALAQCLGLIDDSTS